MSWKSLCCSPAESLQAAARLAGSYLRRGGKLPILVVVLAVFLLAAVMYGEDMRSLAEYSWWRYRALYPADYIPGDVSVPATCDLSDGDWVFDDSYPPYQERSCEFLSKQVSCLQNGRPESKYQKWRWQPKNCSLPRFDARRMLEWLRGKRMLFVGDSINRNQWESMVCLMQTAVPRGRRSRIVDGSRLIFPIKVLSIVPFSDEEKLFHQTRGSISVLQCVKCGGIIDATSWWNSGPITKDIGGEQQYELVEKNKGKSAEHFMQGTDDESESASMVGTSLKRTRKGGKEVDTVVLESVK